MTVISGRKCIASSESFGRLWWWEKTLLASSAWHSTMCLLTWKHKVTPAGRSYYQLQVSVPRTDEIESGLWPTPNTPNGGRAWPTDAEIHGNSAYRPNGQKVQIQLHHLVEGKLLHTPTPTADDASNVTRESGQYQSLTRAVMLPSPTANMRPNEGNVRMYRAMVQAGEMTEEEAHAILGKNVWEAQGKIPALLPTPNAAKAGNDLTLTCSGDGRTTPNKLGWAVAVKMLPTPRAARAGRDCRVYPNSGNHGDLEQEVAKMLPTPRAEGFDAGAHRGKPDSLHSYVKMLPTPTCQAAKHSEPTDDEKENRQGDLHVVVSGKLNPDWVSRMQGFPDGWMELE